MHENNPIKLERRLLVIFYILRISNVNFARRFIIPVPRIQLEVVSENLLPSANFSSPFSLSSVCIFFKNTHIWIIRLSSWSVGYLSLFFRRHDKQMPFN